MKFNKRQNVPAERASAQVGFFETLEHRVLRGWAVDPNAGNKPAVLEILVNGTAAHTVVANQHRADVAAAGFGSAYCGFRFALPDEYQDGIERLFNVRFADTKTLLDGGPRPVAFDRLVGYLEGIRNFEIVGWAFGPPAADTSVPLELVIDGCLVGTFVGTEDRPDVRRAGYSDGSRGFRIPLPPGCHDGEEHSVELRFAETGAPLAGGPQTIVAPPPEGVAFVAPGERAIQGWASIGHEVVLRFDDDEPISVTPTLRFAAFDPKVDHHARLGFRAPVPYHLLDGEWHTVKVAFAQGATLRGSPLAFRLRPMPIELAVVDVSGTRITGFARDPLRPSEPVTLSISADGGPFRSVLADESRTGSALSQEVRNATLFHVDLAPRTKRIDISADESGTPVPIASFDVRWSEGLVRSVRPHAPGETLSMEDFDDPHKVEAMRAAFERFCAQPDGRFDPDWYARAYLGGPETSPQQSLSHYRTGGARDGLSPSARFDEAWYRSAYPAVGMAVADGVISCAFAHYLAFGAAALNNPVPDFEAAAYADRNPAAERASKRGTCLDVFDHFLTDESADLPARAVAGADGSNDGRDDVTKVEVIPRAIPSGPYADGLDALYKRMGLADIQTLVDAERRAFAGVVTPLRRAPLVSIVMPTFNRAYTIAEAVQSVLDQSYTRWELFICDDGSTDKTELVIDQFADPRIKYLKLQKKNGASARNQGLRFSSGEYITYLDSDNIWHPLFISCMLRCIEENKGCRIVYSDYIDTEFVGASPKLIRVGGGPFQPMLLQDRNYIDMNTIFHHRSLFDWLGGFDSELPRLQDYDLVLRYSSVFWPTHLPRNLALYRRNIAWGQVTHVLADQADAAQRVRQRSEDRQSNDHVRLAVDWPRRPSLTLLVGPHDGNPALAAALVDLGRSIADVTVIHSDEIAAGRFTDVATFAVPAAAMRSPAMLARTIAPLLTTDAAIACGLNDPLVSAISAHSALQLDVLRVSTSGLVLESVGRESVTHLGTLPLPLTPPQPDCATDDTEARSWVTIIQDSNDTAQFAGEMLEFLQQWGDGEHPSFLLAPREVAADGWFEVTAAGARRLSGEWIEHVARAVRSSRCIASAHIPGPTDVALFVTLTHALASGQVIIVPGDMPRTIFLPGRNAVSYGKYSIDAIADIDQRLTLKPKDRAKYEANAAKTYRAVLHPELAQERLKAYLHERLVAA